MNLLVFALSPPFTSGCSSFASLRYAFFDLFVRGGLLDAEDLVVRLHGHQESFYLRPQVFSSSSTTPFLSSQVRILGTTFSLKNPR